MNPYLRSLEEWRRDVVALAAPTDVLARRGATLCQLAACWDTAHGEWRTL